MIDEPPPPPSSETQIAGTDIQTVPVAKTADDGRIVIDLTRLVPSVPAERCDADPTDPFHSEIVVCGETRPSPRLGPQVGPVDDGFASAIPRARIKLSDAATAETNLVNQSVGGFNANGGEVRVKIDF